MNSRTPKQTIKSIKSKGALAKDTIQHHRQIRCCQEDHLKMFDYMRWVKLRRRIWYEMSRTERGNYCRTHLHSAINQVSALFHDAILILAHLTFRHWTLMAKPSVSTAFVFCWASLLVRFEDGNDKLIVEKLYNNLLLPLQSEDTSQHQLKHGWRHMHTEWATINLTAKAFIFLQRFGKRTCTTNTWIRLPLILRAVLLLHTSIQSGKKIATSDNSSCQQIFKMRYLCSAFVKDRRSKSSRKGQGKVQNHSRGAQQRATFGKGLQGLPQIQSQDSIQIMSLCKHWWNGFPKM